MTAIEPASDGEVDELRRGLEGVTPGPWVAHGGKFPYGWKGDVFAKDAKLVSDASHIARCLGKPPEKRPLDELQDTAWARAQRPSIEATAAHIARCSPDAIARLLSRLDAEKEARAAAEETARAAVEAKERWEKAANDAMRTLAEEDEEARAAESTIASLQSQVEAMSGCLRECQGALAMMVEPDAVKQTTVVNAYAAAVAAERRARSTLAASKETGA